MSGVDQVGVVPRRAGGRAGGPCRRPSAATARRPRSRPSRRRRRPPPSRRAAGSRPACARTRPRRRSRRSTNSCRTTGSERRATSPIRCERTGTSRQPRARWPSSAQIRTNSSSQRSRSARLARQERHADGVVARCRQVELELLAHHPAQERVGELEQDPGAVAGLGIGAARAAVIHVPERLDAGRDDLARPRAVEPDHRREAARVVLEPRIVEAGHDSTLAESNLSIHFGSIGEPIESVRENQRFQLAPSTC